MYHSKSLHGDSPMARNLSLLLTPAQAAKALAISPRKLWAMTAARKIPHVRLGRSVRYPYDGLEEWILDQVRTASKG